MTQNIINVSYFLVADLLHFSSLLTICFIKMIILFFPLLILLFKSNHITTCCINHWQSILGWYLPSFLFLYQASELESWEEDPSAWAEEITEDLSWEAEAAIREKRKAERQERTLEQQRKKQQRDAARGMKKDTHIAVKISW